MRHADEQVLRLMRNRDAASILESHDLFVHDRTLLPRQEPAFPGRVNELNGDWVGDGSENLAAGVDARRSSLLDSIGDVRSIYETSPEEL
jgi:hypothetical protein